MELLGLFEKNLAWAAIFGSFVADTTGLAIHRAGMGIRSHSVKPKEENRLLRKRTSISVLGLLLTSGCSRPCIESKYRDEIYSLYVVG